MKEKVLLAFLLTACFSKGYSQFFQTEFYNDKRLYYEVGGGIGTMNCITDLGGANGSKKSYINEIRGRNYTFSNSVYACVVYNDIIGARLELTRGKIRSADSDVTGESIDDVYRRNRNLSFKSNIKEIALLFEFHPLPVLDLEPRKGVPEVFITAGVGLYSFKPQTQYQGNWVDLKPLHTEGQGFPEYPSVSNYSLTQINVPIGIGFRYKLTQRFNVRLEYLHRILFTDHLDDASSEGFINPGSFDKNLPAASAANAKALYNRSMNGRLPPRRGNPNNYDTYMTLSLKLGVILGHSK